jgi:DNA-binding response OmpR family regulator
MNEPIPRVLLVDDDQELANMLNEFLELHGMKVEVRESGQAALEKIKSKPPDLVLLDVMLPGMDGFAVLREIRTSHELPVIMLTARGAESDRIVGLMGGADDYLPKPFNPLELVARIRAVLKRAVSGSADDQRALLKAGEISLNLKTRELTLRDTIVAITAAEMHVLEQLLRSPDEVLSRAYLTEHALNRSIEAYDRSIDTLISKLRRKISDSGGNGGCIRSLRGHGYVLDSHLAGNE